MIDHFAVVERDETRTGQRDRAGRRRPRHRELDRGRFGGLRLDVIGRILRPAHELKRRGVPPAREVAALRADWRHGQSALALVDARRRRARAHQRKRQQVGVVALLKGQPSSIRRDARLVRERKDQMRAAVSPVQSNRDELGEFLLLIFRRSARLRVEQASFGAERRLHDRAPRHERPSAVVGPVHGDDRRRIAAARGHPHQLIPEIVRGRSAAQRRAGPARDDDLFAVGTPHRVEVLAGLGCELLRLSAGRWNLEHVPEIEVRPARERDPSSVGRPCGRHLERFEAFGRQAARRS